jgi:hypothetical protein
VKTLLALALALAACKQAKEPAPAGEVITKARALSAAMCACPDRACGAKLKTEWNELTALMHGATFTEEHVEALATEDDRFLKCMQRLER